MDEFIKLLDEHLDYLEHEILDDTIIIYVSSNRKEAICPYVAVNHQNFIVPTKGVFKTFLSWERKADR